MPKKDDTYDMIDSTKKSSLSKIVIACIAVIAIVGLIAMFVLNKKDKDTVAGVVPQKSETVNDQSKTQPTTHQTAEPISGNKQVEGQIVAGVADQNKQEVNVPASSVSIEKTVHFDFDSSVLNANEKNQLESFYEKFKDKKGKLTITGHADSIGTEAVNKWVSKKRSESVLVLFKNAGMSNDIQANIEGYGTSKPISDNSTSDGRAKNRRAEISFVENNK